MNERLTRLEISSRGGRQIVASDAVKVFDLLRAGDFEGLKHNINI